MLFCVLTEPLWRVTLPRSTSEELSSLHCSIRLFSTRDHSPGPTCCCRLPGKNTPAAGGTGERHSGHIWNGTVAGRRKLRALNGLKEKASELYTRIEVLFLVRSLLERETDGVNWVTKEMHTLTISEFVVCLLEIRFRGVSAHLLLTGLKSSPKKRLSWVKHPVSWLLRPSLCA